MKHPNLRTKRHRFSQVRAVQKVAAQEKEIIEAALRESQGRVFGPSGATAKLGIPTVHAGIEDSVTQNQQESLLGLCRKLDGSRSKVGSRGHF